jgi:GlcNAc-P-P-Und epimerase
MTKILVTGGSGFIGTNLINYLLEQSIDILSIDIEHPRIDEHNKYFQKCDIRNYNLFLECCLKFNPDYIIHLAARTDLKDENNIDKYDTNILGVQNLVAISEKIKSLKKVVYTSSMLVNEVGYKPKSQKDYNPNSLYGKSKVIGEQIVFNSNFKNWVIIRPTSIWGPWFDEPYKNFFSFVLNKKYVTFSRDYCSTKTYGFVGNSVKQIIEITFSSTETTNSEIYYIGDYEPLNIFDWANTISKIAGLKPITILPFFIFKLGGKIGDLFLKLDIDLPLTTFRIRNMSTNNVIDLSKTKGLISELPYNLEKGIEITIDWMRNYKSN